MNRIGFIFNSVVCLDENKLLVELFEAKVQTRRRKRRSNAQLVIVQQGFR